LSLFTAIGADPPISVTLSHIWY